MTSSVLSALLARKPFRPFWIWFGGDNEIRVSTPGQVQYEFPGLASRVVTVTDDNGREFLVDLELVAMIEILQ